jgi:hypothetical protein
MNMATEQTIPPRASPSTPSLALEKDVAVALVGENAREIDAHVEARVLSKIDWFLIPAMVVGYGLVYYDKAILGSAVLFGMTKDLALTVTSTATTPPTTNTSRLSWATSLFYFGMLAGLYPMTFALQRFNIGRILGAVVIVWAVVCMLTAAVTTHQGLYVQRFFLGFVESVIPTGFMCVISGYYTQEEQALRQSWYVPCLREGTRWLTLPQVVLCDGAVYDCGICVELRVCADYGRGFEEVAVHLSPRRLSDVPVRHLVFLHSQLAGVGMVSHPGRAHRGG